MDDLRHQKLHAITLSSLNTKKKPEKEERLQKNTHRENKRMREDSGPTKLNERKR